MKTIEIKEGNKIIAEFMGGKMIVQNYHGINIIKFPDETTKDLFGLKYHQYWDWLMPVVEKIANLHLKENVTTLPISSNIKTVWDACLEFIKWYNKQNK